MSPPEPVTRLARGFPLFVLDSVTRQCLCCVWQGLWPLLSCLIPKSPRTHTESHRGKNLPSRYRSTFSSALCKASVCRHTSLCTLLLPHPGTLLALDSRTPPEPDYLRHHEDPFRRVMVSVPCSGFCLASKNPALIPAGSSRLCPLPSLPQVPAEEAAAASGSH